MFEKIPSAAAMALTVTACTADPVSMGDFSQGNFTPGKLIVQFEDAATAHETAQAIDANQYITFDDMIFDQDTLRIGTFTVPVGHEAEFAAQIAAFDNIASVEPDQIVSLDTN